MYDVHSKHADDFISHEEILETLAYAEENKHNIPLPTPMRTRPTKPSLTPFLKKPV